jgi:hypothetical protein
MKNEYVVLPWQQWRRVAADLLSAFKLNGDIYLRRRLRRLQGQKKKRVNITHNRATTTDTHRYTEQDANGYFRLGEIDVCSVFREAVTHNPAELLRLLAPEAVSSTHDNGACGCRCRFTLTTY